MTYKSKHMQKTRSGQYSIDGRPMPATQNTLASVAWYSTKGLGLPDRDGNPTRWPVLRLMDYLNDRGVDNLSDSWFATLPNGKELEYLVKKDGI